MSLMQWLAVSRSLGRVGDEAGRYKMAQSGLVPNFRLSGKTATAAAAAAMEIGHPGGPAVVPRPDTVSAGRDVPRAANAVVSKTNDAKTMNRTETQSAMPMADLPVELRPKFPLGRWTSVRNPFRKRPGPSDSPTTAPGESMLEAVKPVRNELTDSDLVVVQGPRIGRVEPAERRTDPEPQAVWSRLKAKWIGSGGT